MNFSEIVGQLIQQGMSGQSMRRMSNAMGEGGLGSLLGGQNNQNGGSLNNTLSGLLGGQDGNSGNSLANMLGSLMGGRTNMNNKEIGGIGALAGALLGGGSGAVKGALGGGAMAMLGTLAISALRNWQQNAQGGVQAVTPDDTAPRLTETDLQQMTSPQTAELCLKGMIAAAKSDGHIQDEETQRIIGKLKEGGISEEERQLVLDEMRKPLDLDDLIRAIPNKEIGSQVYTAALMAINIDTPSEQNFMQQLAAGIGLDRATVNRLHQMVGAPPVA